MNPPRPPRGKAVRGPKPTPTCPQCGATTLPHTREETIESLKRVAEYLAPWDETALSRDDRYAWLAPFDRAERLKADHDSTARVRARASLGMFIQQLHGLCIDCADEAVKDDPP